MNRQEAPCYTCTRRSQICHGNCREYHDWVAQIKAQNDSARKDSEGAAYAKENRERWRRRRNL